MEIRADTVSMASASNRHSVGTKVETDVYDWVTKEADRLDISMAEMMRRLIEAYKFSKEGKFQCPGCGQPVEVTVA